MSLVEKVFLLVIYFTLKASSQTLPCQLSGGTSCPTMICPNTAVNYTCSAGSYVANTQWAVPSVGGCSVSPLLLAQGPPGSGLSCLNSSSSNAVCGPFTVANLPILTSNTYCLNSTLSVVITSAMNGLVVSCSSYLPISPFTTTPIGSVTISVLLAPPNAPTITSLTSTYSNITVTWTSVPTATSYSVSINSSSSTHVTITSSGPLQNTFTGLTNNTVYTVSVVAINCAGNSSAATAQTSTCGISPTSPAPTTPPTNTSAGSSSVCTAENSSIGTAVGVSVSVTFVVSFSLGVLVASVLCYISRRSKESYKPSSHADPATVYDEVGTNKKMKGDVMQMDTNTAYGSHTS